MNSKQRKGPKRQKPVNGLWNGVTNLCTERFIRRIVGDVGIVP